VGVEVAFVLPMALPHDAASHVSFRTPTTLVRPPAQAEPGQQQASTTAEVQEAFERVTMHPLPAILQPYGTPGDYEQAMKVLQERLGTEEMAKLMGKATDVPIGEILSGGFGRYSNGTLPWPWNWPSGSSST